ncbi:MAG: hypothetical protein H0U75_02430 [Legionella sp.]|nr:hypothetical protein [Legionella sp.]
MPIINKKSMDISPIKAQVNPNVLEQIENYCHWAGIYDIGYFIEKAANELFLKDLEWNFYKKQIEELIESSD